MVHLINHVKKHAGDRETLGIVCVVRWCLMKEKAEKHVLSRGVSQKSILLKICNEIIDSHLGTQDDRLVLLCKEMAAIEALHKYINADDNKDCYRVLSHDNWDVFAATKLAFTDLYNEEAKIEDAEHEERVRVIKGIHENTIRNEEFQNEAYRSNCNLASEEYDLKVFRDKESDGNFSAKYSI